MINLLQHGETLKNWWNILGNLILLKEVYLLAALKYLTSSDMGNEGEVEDVNIWLESTGNVNYDPEGKIIKNASLNRIIIELTKLEESTSGFINKFHPCPSNIHQWNPIYLILL
jgi:hypothetical protein